MNDPIGIEETLAHFTTAYTPKHHPELTAPQQIRINQIDAYRAQRHPRLKQKTPVEQVNLILVLGWLSVACIGCAIGLAITWEFVPGDQMQIHAAHKAQLEAEAVEVAANP